MSGSRSISKIHHVGRDILLFRNNTKNNANELLVNNGIWVIREKLGLLFPTKVNNKVKSETKMIRNQTFCWNRAELPYKRTLRGN